MKKFFIFYLLMYASIDSFCQLALDFDDNNLNKVMWLGDIQNFIINSNNQLQLKAAVAGESSIFTKYKIPEDSIQVDLYFSLRFAPSNDNYSKIYLFVDNIDESKANGYYLRLGENGSNDAIQLWKLTNGVGRMLGSGINGAISQEPAIARLRIKIYRDGLWVFTTDYSGGNLFKDDFELFEVPSFSSDSTFFGIYCKYSITRADKFVYDDINIKTVEKDIQPPSVLEVKVLDDQQLQLTFSEPIREVDAKNIENYSISPTIGKPKEVVFSNLNPGKVILIYPSNTFKSSISYSLSINNIRDLAGNFQSQVIDFNFYDVARKGDLVISEVLTDPITGGDDFIELYNISNKFIKLDSLTIINKSNDQRRLIRSDLILKPGQYVAISNNIDFLKQQYNTPDSSLFIKAALPALNVESANITITTIFKDVVDTLDSFNYFKSYHHSQLKITKGVSLEKIQLAAKSDDNNNWHSASSTVNYGTPGYQNSQNRSIDDVHLANKIFEPYVKVFSPNGDGIDDFVILQYKVDKNGYLATIKVFDSEGRWVTDLANNLLMSIEGSIKWDGTDQNGSVLPMGLYVISSRIFHVDGTTKSSKHAVAIAHRL